MSPDADLRETTERIATPLQDTRTETESAFVFRVRDEWFALPTAVCERALERCIVHSVPHRRGGVLLGIGSVEGDLIPVVALAAVLHPRGESGAAAETRVLLLNRQRRRFAAPVDEVYGVVRYDPADLLPLPATTAASTFVSGLLSRGDRSVALLDPARLIDALARGVA